MPNMFCVLVLFIVLLNLYLDFKSIIIIDNRIILNL